MGLFDELKGEIQKPGTANTIALRRELESRRDRWEMRPGDLYRGAGDYLLRHGTFFTGRALPDAYVQHYGAPNECFNNAMEAALANPDLRYFEGLYADHSSFTPHAWCVAPDGGVVELTWPTRSEHGVEGGIAGANNLGMRIGAPERIAYVGVELHPEFVHWFAFDEVGEFCFFDRPSYDKKPVDEGPQVHDFEIYRYPYDKDRRTFPRGTQAP